MKIHQYLLCASLVLPAAAWADVSEEVNYNFDVNSGARFRLENVNGNVYVSGWDAANIEVVAIKTADDHDDLERLEIIVDSSSDEVHIKTKHHKSGSWFNWSDDNSGEVEYHIKAPRDLILRDVETVNGNVEIEGLRASVSAETVNGDVEMRDVSADVDLETVNGGIRARYAEFGAGQSGSFDTVNGSITVYLPQDVSARVEAETVNGSIKNDFGLTVDKGLVSRSLSGQLGSGEGRLRFETVNGSIKIRGQ